MKVGRLGEATHCGQSLGSLCLHDGSLCHCCCSIGGVCCNKCTYSFVKLDIKPMVRELLNIMHSVYVNACACEAHACNLTVSICSSHPPHRHMYNHNTNPCKLLRSESAAKCQSQPTRPLKSGYISHSDRPDTTDLTSTATTHHSPFFSPSHKSEYAMMQSLLTCWCRNCWCSCCLL